MDNNQNGGVDRLRHLLAECGVVDCWRFWSYNVVAVLFPHLTSCMFNQYATRQKSNFFLRLASCKRDLWRGATSTMGATLEPSGEREICASD